MHSCNIHAFSLCYAWGCIIFHRDGQILTQSNTQKYLNIIKENAYPIIFEVWHKLWKTLSQDNNVFCYRASVVNKLKILGWN